MTRTLAFAVSMSIVLAGCGGGSEAAPVAMCSPQDGPLAADASFDASAGEYLLILVATSGDSAGREVSGSLWLEPNDSTLRQFARPGGDPIPTVTVPLFGWTDVPVQGVAALELGDLSAREPAMPGVLVLEQRSQPTGPPSITVRLGSIANNRAVAPFDGGYTALRVGWLEESGAFGGSWASGVRNEQAAGHFCAVPR